MTLEGQPIRRRAAGSCHPRAAHAWAARLLRMGSRGPLARPPAPETPSFPFCAPFRLEKMAGRVVPSVKPDTRLGGPTPRAARPRPSLQPLGPRGLRGGEPRAGARTSGAVPPPALPRLAAPAKWGLPPTSVPWQGCNWRAGSTTSLPPGRRWACPQQPARLQGGRRRSAQTRRAPATPARPVGPGPGYARGRRPGAPRALLTWCESSGVSLLIIYEHIHNPTRTVLLIGRNLGVIRYGNAPTEKPIVSVLKHKFPGSCSVPGPLYRMTFPISLPLPPSLPPSLPFTGVSGHIASSLFRKYELHLIPDTSMIKHLDSYMEVQELRIQTGNFFPSKWFPTSVRYCPGSAQWVTDSPRQNQLWSHHSGIQEGVQQGKKDRLAFIKGLHGIFVVLQRTSCRSIQFKRLRNFRWTLKFWERIWIRLRK